MDRKIQLIIDGYICPLKKVEAGLLQSSLILFILFAIYISGFFGNIEEKCFVIILSFEDDIGILAIESFI
jgi:hypothetical protein